MVSRRVTELEGTLTNLVPGPTRVQIARHNLSQEGLDFYRTPKRCKARPNENEKVWLDHDLGRLRTKQMMEDGLRGGLFQEVMSVLSLHIFGQ